MLVQLDPSAAPCPDEPGRWSHELRPGLCVEPWHDPVIDEVGHDPRRPTWRLSGFQSW